MAPGIVLANRFEVSTGLLVALGLFLAFTILLWLRREPSPIRFGLLILTGFALGMELGLVQQLPPPKNHFIHLLESHGNRLAIEGRLIGSPEKARKSWHATIETERCGIPGNPMKPCTGRLLLYVSPPGPTQLGGERIRFEARLRPLSHDGNPGAFDYTAYLARRDILATAYIRDAHTLETVEPPGFLSILSQKRSEFARFVERRFPHEDSGWVLALTVGMRKSVSHEMRQLFSEAGTAHLLAISGLHLGIVALFVFLLVRQSLRFAPRILLYIEANRLAAAVTLPILWLYAVLAGLQLSTVRAGTMITVFLLSKLLLRRSDGLNSLFLAGFLILTFDPNALFDLSFQLSFISVLAILTMIPRHLSATSLPMATPRPMLRVIARVRTYFFSILMTSLVCFLATLPIIGLRFGLIPIAGVLANLIAVPLVTLAALPMFALGLVAWMISGVHAAPFVEAGAWIMHGAIALQQPLVDLLPSIRQPAIPVWFVVSWYVSLLFLWSVLQKPVLATLVLVLLTVGLAPGWGFPRADPLSLRLLHLRSGAAAIVEWPDAPPWLYLDTDDEENERAVMPYLRHRGIRNLGWLYALNHVEKDIPEALIDSFPPGYLSLGSSSSGKPQLSPNWPKEPVHVDFFAGEGFPPALGLIRFCLENNCLVFVPHPENTDARFWDDLPGNWRAFSVISTGPIAPRDYEAMVARLAPRQVAFVSSATQRKKLSKNDAERLTRFRPCLWRTDEQGSILARPVGGKWEFSAVNPPTCAHNAP